MKTVRLGRIEIESRASASEREPRAPSKNDVATEEVYRRSPSPPISMQ